MASAQSCDPDAVHRAARQFRHVTRRVCFPGDTGGALAVLTVKIGDVAHGQIALLPGNRRVELLAVRADLNGGRGAGL